MGEIAAEPEWRGRRLSLLLLLLGLVVKHQDWGLVFWLVTAVVDAPAA